jgi:triacylglycerol lipase
MFDSFNPNTTKWNPFNALGLAEAAQLAYRDQPTIVSVLQQNGFPNARYIERRETQLFVASNDQMVVVAFRGTEPAKIKDWMTDADIVAVPATVGCVHDGFNRALGFVWDDLTATIQEFRSKAQSLWFTGHSLGAALACLAVSRFVFDLDKPVSGLYTYGQPRVGDRDFARGFDVEFKSKTFRFINDADIVTRVPPRSLGYSHVGRLLFFDKEGVLHNDDHFWQRFLQEVEVGTEVMENFPTLVTKHAIALYIENMRKNLTTPLTW